MEKFTEKYIDITEEIRCGNCGGNNVEGRVWIKVNVSPIEISMWDEDEDGMWCVDCKDNTHPKEEDE